MSHPEHPTLRVLGLPLLGERGEDPFSDIVYAHTPLGYFGATRMSDRSWHWYLITVERAPDDFDSIGTDVYGDLAACIDNANRQLEAVLKQQVHSIALHAHLTRDIVDVIERLNGAAYTGSMGHMASMKEGIARLERVAKHLGITLPKVR